MAKRKILAPQATQIENRISTIDEVAGPPPKDQDSPEHRRALARHEDRKKFVTIGDQIARETLYLRNYRWPESSKYFPDDIDAHLRFVTKYYPHAEGGPLFVDEPTNHREIVESYKKQKLLRKCGFRAIVVEPQHYTPEGRLAPGSTMAECLEQLG